MLAVVSGRQGPSPSPPQKVGAFKVRKPSNPATWIAALFLCAAKGSALSEHLIHSLLFPLNVPTQTSKPQAGGAFRDFAIFFFGLATSSADGYTYNLCVQFLSIYARLRQNLEMQL